MALRRACAKFGIARYLWAKDEKPKSNQSPSNIFKTTPPREKGTISKEEHERRKANGYYQTNEKKVLETEIY
jgi:hypothetical protein